MRPLSVGKLLPILAVGALAACNAEPVTSPVAERSLEDAAMRVSSSRHVFVLTQEDVPSSELLDEIHIMGALVEHEYDDIGVLVVRGLDDDDVADLRRREDIEGIDRDLSVQWVPRFEESGIELMETPTTETDQSGAFYYAQGMQWNISQIRADDAWLKSGQGAGTTVAILDSGIDPFHIDLDGKVLATSASAITPGTSPCGADDETTIYDLNFHGTFVAGLVSTNGLAISSVAPDADLLAVKVLNCSGNGSFADIIAGIVYATDAGADVINLSLGAYFSRSEEGARSLIRALQRAVLYASIRGTLIVASSGNGGIDLDHDGDFIHVPSQLLGVLSVGATAPYQQMDFDALATYTNYGRSGVDVMAPGGDLLDDGTCAFNPTYRCDLVVSAISGFVSGGNNFYGAGGGTSFASPMVAATGAVVASSSSSLGIFRRFRFDDDEGLTVCILRGADDLGPRGRDPYYGFGRLNVLGALDACTGRGHGRGHGR